MKQQPFYLKIGGQDRPALFTKKSHELFEDMELDLKLFLKTEATNINYDLLALVTILLQNGSVATESPAYWWEQVMEWFNEASEEGKGEILRVILKQGIIFWQHADRQN